MPSSLILASVPTVWKALHYLWWKPVTLHAGHRVGTMETAEVVVLEEKAGDGASMSLAGLVPENLSPLQ